MFSMLTLENLLLNVSLTLRPYFSLMVASAMNASVIVFLISATLLAIVCYLKGSLNSSSKMRRRTLLWSRAVAGLTSLFLQ